MEFCDVGRDLGDSRLGDCDYGSNLGDPGLDACDSGSELADYGLDVLFWIGFFMILDLFFMILDRNLVFPDSSF